MSYNFNSLKNKQIAIVGVSGAVGREFLKILEKASIPAKNIIPLASERSAGQNIPYLNTHLTVQKLTHNSFYGIDIALFSAGSPVSKEFRKACEESKCIIVDNSSAFRMEEGVPLIVPEINPQDIKKHNGVIANPNCSTIIMLMAVFPIHQKYKVKRIVVSTYQAASGAGWAAMEELKQATQSYLNNTPFNYSIMPHPYAFNLFSHNAKIDLETGYNEEEIKMIKETHKILNDTNISISPTCIRVPVLRAHSESINLEFENNAPSIDEVRKLLNTFHGVIVVDDRNKNYFPMPIEASEKYECLVGRIRQDIANPKKNIELFVSGDQLLKGAALNAVQIAALL